MNEPTSTGITSGQLAIFDRISTSGRPVQWIGSALLLAEILGGTSIYAAPPTAGPLVSAVQQWTSNGVVEMFIPVRGTVIPTVTSTRSLQEAVISLRNLTGLTWEQLARLFGVSRRAIHLWASGGRMNSYHAERLNYILTIMRSVQTDSNQEFREVLLAPRTDGRSLYEELLAERVANRGINAPAFPPEQLVGALHDRSA